MADQEGDGWTTGERIGSRPSLSETEHGPCARRIAELEAQNTQLIQLNVASQRLHETMTRRDVISAIEEIVINLVGSEQVALFEVVDETMVLLSATGVDAKKLGQVRFGEGIVGRAAIRGETWIRERDGVGGDDPPSMRGLSAVVPLVMRGTVVGVVAMFRLLGQKRGLDKIDHDIFELLRQQGAVVLYCTSFDSTRPTARPPSMSRVRT